MVKNMPDWCLRCDRQIQREQRPNIIVARTIGLKYLNCTREGKDSRKTPEVNSEERVVERKIRLFDLKDAVVTRARM
jgi:hypothetical protein